MPPNLALLLWVILLTVLLLFDPAKGAKPSPALWVPLIWLIILGSRLPSQWLGIQVVGTAAQAMEEGNPLDRTISSLLIVLAIAILVSRSFNWSKFVTRNGALSVFLLFALLSICWSDSPFVAAKRWVRDLGTYLVILVILSDRNPLEGVRTVLRRLAYGLVSLSIVLDKYFPLLSKQYDPWTGAGYYVGVTTSKNMLGLLCLVSGLFFSWDTVMRWPSRRQRSTKRVLLVNIAFLGMTLWELQTSQSTTSTVCLLLGSLVITATQFELIRRRPGLLKVLIPASFCLYLILDFVFGMNGSMAEAVGKDPTLTDRTKIWSFLLGMNTNPIIGTGYQSFWLGPRLDFFWSNAGLGHLNEAHNGYLEIYLELGFIGVVLLVAFLIASYRSTWSKRGPSSSLAIFGLAVWIAFVFYNMSEAAFEAGLMYSVFLMVAIRIPAPSGHLLHSVSADRGHRHRGFAPENASTPIAALSVEPKNPRR